MEGQCGQCEYFGHGNDLCGKQVRVRLVRFYHITH